MNTALVELTTDDGDMSPLLMKEACESFESFRAVICEALAVLGSAGVEDVAEHIHNGYDGNWSIGRTTLFNNITALRADGLIEVCRDIEAHRGRHYRLTPLGRTRLTTWMTIRLGRMRAVADALTKNDPTP